MGNGEDLADLVAMIAPVYEHAEKIGVPHAEYRPQIRVMAPAFASISAEKGGSPLSQEAAYQVVKACAEYARANLRVA